MSAAEDYERLAMNLADRLAAHLGVLTRRCEHRVLMPGKGTNNEIDVVWEGNMDGALHRIVIECKHYKRRVNQGLLHQFRSVVDDIADGVPTTGVFVTTKGYQKGAKDLASTYDLVVLELREPDAADVDGVVTQIDIAIILRSPTILDLQVEPDAVALGENFSTEPFKADLLGISLEFPDGHTERLFDRLIAGEVSPLGQSPTPLHVVTRILPRGTVLRADKTAIPVRAVRASVGDSDSTASAIVGPGPDGIAHILKDAISGATVWFESDGSIRQVS